jgi:hypothetical protein
MRNIFRSGLCGNRGHLWPVLIIAAVTLLFGCQAPEAPLSPGAATFKQELKSCLGNLATSLIEPVAKKDLPAIKAAMEKAESPAVKLCRLCPFEIGVLSPSGETLSSYPPKENDKPKNYSNYDVVIKVIKSKKIQQQQLFLPDGAKLYLVCAPLIRDHTLIGLVAIAINSDEAKKRWDLKEKEFLSLDFNS